MEPLEIGQLLMVHGLGKHMYLGIITTFWFDSVAHTHRYNIYWCNNTWGEDKGIYHATAAPYRKEYLKWRQKNLEPAI